MADSWVKGVKGKADITPGKLAERAGELMKRRKPGQSLMFVVDEVGQFVARDVQKMLDLQAIVQQLGVKGRGKHWVAFDGAVLAQAIAATFANRETAIDVAPIAFTPDFTEQVSTLAQWTAFRKKLPNTECPEGLAEVVPFLSEFLLPIARACAAGESFEQRWPPGGPWT